MGMRLPDAAQQTIFDREGAPIAIADFFYQSRLIVFIEGSPHYQDYVKDADERKRLALRRLGCRIAVVRGSNLEEDMQALKASLG